MSLYMTVSIITYDSHTAYTPPVDHIINPGGRGLAAGSLSGPGGRAGSRGLAAGRRRLMVAARAGAGRPRTGRQRGERQADGAW